MHCKLEHIFLSPDITIKFKYEVSNTRTLPTSPRLSPIKKGDSKLCVSQRYIERAIVLLGKIQNQVIRSKIVHN